MALHDLTFPSANGRDQIHGWIWSPAAPPRAVVQLVHGLGEHSRRYIHLISALLDAGFVVVADDHAGHGATAAASGVWQDTGENGVDAVLADERTLHDIAVEKYPDLPFVMFGHSWGSMIARAYATRFGSDLSAIALCGVAAQMEGMDRVLDRAALDAAAEKDGTAAALEFLGDLFYGFLDRCGPDATPNAWVARDTDVLVDHADDPLNGGDAVMSLRFARDLVEMYDKANADNWAEPLATDLPILVLAGDQDPVANYGEGALHVANHLWRTGYTNVESHIYPDVRHEIHNEPETRQDVEETLIAFIDSAIG